VDRLVRTDRMPSGAVRPVFLYSFRRNKHRLIENEFVLFVVGMLVCVVQGRREDPHGANAKVVQKSF
jgi:hypothetical protein